MATERDFLPVKLFCGFIYREEIRYSETRNILIDKFGESDIETDPIVFDNTSYYNSEMGTPLYRRFISFKALISPSDLPDIKILTNSLERDFSNNSRREVNLDPGYLSDANIIIGTAKNHYHRVPLDKGIYAHIEYMLRKDEFITMEWTYPDFKKPEYMAFFHDLKNLYKKQAHTLRGKQ